jgi:hypothetical protein
MVKKEEERVKRSIFSRRAPLFGLIVLVLVLLACAATSSGQTAIAGATPTSNATVVSTVTPHVAKTDTILDAEGTATLPDGSIGLVRLTGYDHTWSHAPSAPVGDQGATLTKLQLTITTGNDDLRDDANVVIHYATAGDMTYTSVKRLSGTYDWGNGVTNSLVLSPIPPATTVGDIQSISIVTAFYGGASGDNWDILSVKLVATFLS